MPSLLDHLHTGECSAASSRLQVWVNRLGCFDIPVLETTNGEISLLAQCQDEVDANGLGEIIALDPLMTLKVLVHAALHRPERMVTDLETVTSSLVMMGIGPFFRQFSELRTVEHVLGVVPEALEGLNLVLRRAHRASRFALGFAVHRGDQDAAAIHLAALLHDFAEMLLWCDAPDAALEISRRLGSNSALRSAAVQSDVLGVDLSTLQHALMQRWRLPELLIRISDDAHARHPQVRCVLLAVRLARHTAHGWGNAAVPDDLLEAASVLNMTVANTTEFVRSIDD